MGDTNFFSLKMEVRIYFLFSKPLPSPNLLQAFIRFLWDGNRL